MKDAYRYYFLADEGARQRRLIEHEYGRTVVLADCAEALWRTELFAKECSEG